MSEENKTESGFKISDRRIVGRDEAEKQGTARQEENSRTGQAGAGEPDSDAGRQSPPDTGRSGSASGYQEDLPPLDFSSFILSLWTSALIQLGEVEDPVRKKKEKNIPAAKQTIDLIGLLKEKTKGNLTDQEQNTIDYMLFDLRMKYVKAV